MKYVIKGFKVFFVLLLAVCTLLGVSIFGYCKQVQLESIERMKDVDLQTFQRRVPTEIYGEKGIRIGEIGGEAPQVLNIEELSPLLYKSYIAVEDRSFQEHNGIDKKAILRAGIEIIKNKGEITQGGSTITQQVIKNGLLTREKSLVRKIREYYMAPLLEEKIGKDGVMLVYVNQNSYGNNCEGVVEASRYYFGKTPKELKPEEVALLVGLSNNPTRYNPLKHPKAAKDKRDFVLSIMHQQGVITDKEYAEGKSNEIKVAKERVPYEVMTDEESFALHSAILYIMKTEKFPFKYTFQTKKEEEIYRDKAQGRYQEIKSDILRGGYKINTTLNPLLGEELQKIAERELLKQSKERTKENKYALQTSITVVDNQTGNVIGVVGSRDIEDEFNRVFLGARQPGSSMKPLVAYGVAYDTGKFNPSTRRTDIYEEKGPKNWDAVYRGKVSLREALGRSINTVAQGLVEEIGTETCIEYLGKMEFRSLSYLDTTNSAIALGGLTVGATTVDMAKGYSTVVNQGKYLDTLCITGVEFQGKKIEREVKETQVYDVDAAYMLLDTLRGTMLETYGLGRGLNIEGYALGGKSGTTNDQKDVWYCGFSPDYTVAVWVGYDTPRSTDMYGMGAPGEIWKKSMQYLYKGGYSGATFKRPSTITERYVNTTGQYVKWGGKKELYSERLNTKWREKWLQIQREQLQKREKAEYTRVVESLQKLDEMQLVGESGLVSFERQIGELEDSISKLRTETYKIPLQEEMENVKERKRVEIEREREKILEEREQEKERKKVKYSGYADTILRGLETIPLKTVEDLEQYEAEEEKVRSYYPYIEESEYEGLMTFVRDTRSTELHTLRLQREEKRKEEERQLQTRIYHKKEIEKYILEFQTMDAEKRASIRQQIEAELGLFEEQGGNPQYRLEIETRLSDIEKKLEEKYAVNPVEPEVDSGIVME